MGYIKKDEYIARYGKEAWEVEHERRNATRRDYYSKNREKILLQQKEALEKDPGRKERMLDYHKNYYTENKDTILAKQKEHRWKDNIRQQRIDYQKEYYENNREDILKQQGEYQKEHREEANTRTRRYYSSQKGRANNLKHQYARQDREANRGECTLTRDWIMDKIFASSCVYCGDSDWRHLGCDRIDNNLPHTPENCVCACGICNIDRFFEKMSVEEFKEYRKTHQRECDEKGAAELPPLAS